MKEAANSIHSNDNVNASGFSLLEVLLSLSLASLLLLAGSYLLQSITQRANWWNTTSEMVMVRQSVVTALMSLGDQVCQPGLSSGGVSGWRWQMLQSGQCQIYDVRFNSSKRQIQKRRLGGRYTGFIDSLTGLVVSYGVAEANHCTPTQWLSEVTNSEAHQTVLLRLQFSVGVQSSTPTYGLPSGWAVNQVGDENWLWQPTQVVIRLPCVLTKKAQN